MSSPSTIVGPDPGTPLLRDLTDEAVAVAAKFWADHLRERTPKNNGVPLHGMFADMATSGLQITPAEIDAFETALKAELLSEFEAHDLTKKRVTYDGERLTRIERCRYGTHVDYGPCVVLRNAIKACGEIANGTASNRDSKIASLLPWKTDLYISTIGVVDSVGYGAARKPLWSAYSEVRLGDESPYQVVDRWDSGNRGGKWRRGGNPNAKLAFIKLGSDVQPEPVALVLNGIVDIESYGSTLEDSIAYDFSNAYQGGYLALVEVK